MKKTLLIVMVLISSHACKKDKTKNQNDADKSNYLIEESNAWKVEANAKFPSSDALNFLKSKFLNYYNAKFHIGLENETKVSPTQSLTYFTNTLGSGNFEVYKFKNTKLASNVAYFYLPNLPYEYSYNLFEQGYQQPVDRNLYLDGYSMHQFQYGLSEMPCLFFPEHGVSVTKDRWKGQLSVLNITPGLTAGRVTNFLPLNGQNGQYFINNVLMDNEFSKQNPGYYIGYSAEIVMDQSPGHNFQFSVVQFSDTMMSNPYGNPYATDGSGYYKVFKDTVALIGISPGYMISFQDKNYVYYALFGENVYLYKYDKLTHKISKMREHTHAYFSYLMTTTGSNAFDEYNNTRNVIYDESSGNLYFENADRTIQKYNLATGIITSFPKFNFLSWTTGWGVPAKSNLCLVGDKLYYAIAHFDPNRDQFSYILNLISIDK